MTGPILHRRQEEDKKRPRECPIIPTDTEAPVSALLLPMVSVRIQIVSGSIPCYGNSFPSPVSLLHIGTALFTVHARVYHGGCACFVKPRGQASTLLS